MTLVFDVLIQMNDPMANYEFKLWQVPNFSGIYVSTRRTHTQHPIHDEEYTRLVFMHLFLNNQLSLPAEKKVK